MTSALKLKPDKELAKLVGRHIICTEKARRRKKEQSLVRNITLSLPFMVWLHGSNVVHNPRGWGWVGRLVQGCGRILTTTPIYSLYVQSLIGPSLFVGVSFIIYNQNCSVSKETTVVIATRGILWPTKYDNIGTFGRICF